MTTKTASQPPSSAPKPSISGDFEVIRVQTMANNAIRLVLEMPETMIPQMSMFAECHRQGIYLHGEFTALDRKGTENAWTVT
jgi:hypothetical protein